jgi:hypothetical protein
MGDIAGTTGKVGTERIGRGTRRRTVAPIILAGLLAFAAFQPAAAARPTGTYTPPGLTVSAQDQARAARFSIKDIMKKAKALKVGVDKGDNVKRQGPDGPQIKVRGVLPDTAAGAIGTTAAAPAAPAAPQNGAWPGGYAVNPNRQVGKLYYDIKKGPGEDWKHCSATAINSENRSVVLTAGHCVFNPDPDGNGVVESNKFWYEWVQFCPGYEFGCKLGVWHSRQVYTTDSWFYGTGANKAKDWSDDIAIVLVKPNNQGLIVNAVGGQGITFNLTVGRQQHAFGYPVTDWRWPEYTYSGEDLMYCTGTDWYDGYGHLRIPCTMTGGASGGPWITSPAANWLGYVNSVNSHKAWGGLYMGGPYFGKAESDLFTYARNR